MATAKLERIIEELLELRKLRKPVRERGRVVRCVYGNREESVYAYPIFAGSDSKTLFLHRVRVLVDQLDAQLARTRRQESRWLRDCLRLFTGMDIADIASLQLSDFCPNDDLLQRVGFDKWLGAIVFRSQSWVDESVNVDEGRKVPLPQIPAFKPVEIKCLLHLGKAQCRLTADKITTQLSSARDPASGWIRAALKRLKDQGLIDNERQRDSRGGYQLTAEGHRLLTALGSRSSK